MAFKRPRRSDLTSDLKFEAQTIYDTTFVSTVWASVRSLLERLRKMKRTTTIVALRFAPQLKMYLNIAW